MDQILTFMAAGRATSAGATQWILYYLSLNLDVQNKLREELLEHMPDPLGDVSADYVMGSTSYLDAVMKESLRMTPPVTRISRQAKEYDIVDGIPVPKGTIIFISPDALHKSIEYWGPDADDFNPSRWLNKKATDFDNLGTTTSSLPDSDIMGGFSPFMMGPRNCIGSKFATTEIRVLTAYLIRNFEFTPVPGFVIQKDRKGLVQPLPYLQLRVRRVV